MALKSYLTIEKKRYSLLECSYEFRQSVDITGRPSDRPRGGVLEMVFVSPDDTDMLFHEWMKEKDLVKDGEVLLMVNKDGEFSEKRIRFKDAYCIRLREYFNDGNALPMYTEISVVANELTFGDDCTFKMID